MFICVINSYSNTNSFRNSLYSKNFVNEEEKLTNYLQEWGNHTLRFQTGGTNYCIVLHTHTHSLYNKKVFGRNLSLDKFLSYDDLHPTSRSPTFPVSHWRYFSDPRNVRC